MKKILSIALIAVMALSVAASVSMAQILTYHVVWVDDDYDGDAAPYFASLSSAVGHVASGGTVNVAPGSYDACTVTRDMTIVGAGADAVTIDCSSHSLDISGTSSFSISGCTLEGGTENVYGSFNSTAEVTITDCVIRGATTPLSGIHLNVSGTEAFIEITNNHIVDNIGAGVYVSYAGNSSGAVTVSDNVITGNTAGGIELECGSLNDWGDVTYTVERNTVDDNTGGPGLSFAIYNGLFPVLHVDANSFNNNGEEGILFTTTDGAYASTDGEPEISSLLSFTNNEINDNTGDGFRVNIVYFRDMFVLAEDPVVDEIIFVFDVADNTMSSNGGNGFSCGYNDITPHSTLDTEISLEGSDYFGIPTLQKNIITDNTLDGIHLGSDDPWLISNNLIARNGENGMYIFDGQCFTANNTIAYNGKSGITFANNFAAQLERKRIYVPGIYVNNIIARNGDYGVNFGKMIPNKIGDTEISELPFVANDVWGNEEGNYCPGEADVTGMSGNISSDPMFVSPSDMHLLAVSPCIDVGADIFTLFLQKDLDGTTRPRGEGFDMGCYELIWNNFSPETFHPLVITQLANANATWTCLMSNLP
ncbi:MAG TPA: right-handed parallel beta-helix repeat-containing protein, partial [Methanomicrobia archaeon]|nr:right-handed parallel beta-helix repeat-containing protein [Methanomicrobia archaeon]